MLNDTQIEQYREKGYVGVEGVLSADEVASLRRVTDEFVERSRAISGAMTYSIWNLSQR